MLTLRGWKASNVTYYSKHPDDLGPLFRAKEVLLFRKRVLPGETDKGWEIDIEASDIQWNPSVEWGVSIPENSSCRNVDSVRLSIGIFPDRVEFSKGAMTWLGVDFKLQGTVLKPDPDASDSIRPRSKPGGQQSTVLPVYVSSEQFQSFEDQLRILKIDGEAEVNIGFLIDAEDYSKSAADISLEARRVSIRDIDFDELQIKGSYAFPELRFEQVRVSRGGASFAMDTVYDLQTKLIQANVNNSIKSPEMLLLAPQVVLDLLVKAQFQIEELPQFSLQLGPAEAVDILDAVSGSFSIRNLTYCGLVIESARGHVERKDNRLDLSRIHATVQGQEDRAEEVGSALQGGSMEGSVYWDANANWFGVKAEGSMDPNLFLQPLAIVPIATNVIGRFHFPETSPQISLELGASYVDWSTFFIQVQGMGNQVRFHEGLCSSLNTTAFYSNAVLRLDPLAIMSGADFMKGTASLDFRSSTVNFDAFGTLSPELLEDAVYSDFNLFGNKIKTSGNTQIKARGALDWKTMKGTDFRAEVETERMEIPIAAMDHFTGVVIGDGPQISVSNAVFDIYGGKGNGEFSIQFDPESAGMPYSARVDLLGSDFKQCLQFVELPCRERTGGTMDASARFEADMHENFFESANGTGTIAVVDGELTDIPLFAGFSKLMRKVIPGFNALSITSLHADYTMNAGVLKSRKVAFEGNVFSAKASGTYSQKTGFDAMVQVQLLNKKGLGMVIRAITNPIFKLFELRLSGSLADPSWRLENFTSGGQSKE
ncbi:hypothetical protein P4C99_08625 [Pontiellaceae bacterium B1224]|nr:hypothetical protein [Pontiellaceae bacterium B1224]